MGGRQRTRQRCRRRHHRSSLRLVRGRRGRRGRRRGQERRVLVGREKGRRQGKPGTQEEARVAVEVVGVRRGGGEVRVGRTRECRRHWRRRRGRGRSKAHARLGRGRSGEKQEYTPWYKHSFLWKFGNVFTSKCCFLRCSSPRLRRPSFRGLSSRRIFPWWGRRRKKSWGRRQRPTGDGGEPTAGQELNGE